MTAGSYCSTPERGIRVPPCKPVHASPGRFPRRSTACLEGKRAGKSVTRQIPNFLRKLIHSNELWHIHESKLL